MVAPQWVTNPSVSEVIDGGTCKVTEVIAAPCGAVPMSAIDKRPGCGGSDTVVYLTATTWAEATWAGPGQVLGYMCPRSPVRQSGRVSIAL